MPYNPATKIRIKVELEINGTRIEVTSRSRKAGGVQIKHGRSDGAIQGEPSICELTIGNDDGWLTEENPMSPWFPYITSGCPIFVSLVGILPGDASRFEGEIEETDPEYPGGPSSSVHITALGALGSAMQTDDLLESAMYRQLSTISPQPIAWWPLEESEHADFAASGLTAGQPLVGNITFAAADGPDGAASAVSLRNRGTMTGSVTGCSTTEWHVEHSAFWPEVDSPAASSRSIEIPSTGTVASWRIDADNSPNLIRLLYLPPAAGIYTALTSTAVAFDGEHKHIRFSAIQDGADIDVTLTVNGTVVLSSTISSQTMGAAGAVSMSTDEDVPDNEIPSVSHVIVWSGTAPNVADTHAAFTGWAGEQAHERIERLGVEQNLPIAIVGLSSARMGPQRVARLADLFMDCEHADQGLLSDGGSITYRTLSSLYNQDAAVTVTKGSLTKNFKPTWDNQRVANDWTVSRVGGSSARVADEEHVTRTRRRSKRTAQVVLETDFQLASHAGWRINVSTKSRRRYAQGGINLRNRDGAALADDILAVIPGDRMVAGDAALPAQHPPGGVDQMIVGWTEFLQSDQWLFMPVMVAYAPYNEIGIYGTDAANSRYDSAHSTLAAGYSSSATSFSVATVANHKLWIVGSGGGFAFDIEVSGIRITVTAVSGASSPQTFTVTRNVDGYDKALLSGAQVRLWDPARYGL